MTSDQISEARQAFLGCVYRNAQSSPCEIGRLFAHQVHDQKELTTEVVKLMDAAFTVAMAESQDLRMQLEALKAEKYALEDQVRGLQELMDLPSDWEPLANKLQEVGLAYWKAHHRERGPDGAVKWLHNEESGALFVVTRGEYSQELKDFIFSLDSPAVKPAVTHMGGYDFVDATGSEVMCKGDKALGTACGSCKRCKAREE